MTANYLYHYDDFPVIQKRIVNAGLILSPGYERMHTFGISASNAFGEFIFRTEAVFNKDKYFVEDSIDQAPAPTTEFAFVLGLDWSGLTDTFFSVQLFQSYLLNGDDFVRDNIDTTLTFLLRRNFMNESFNLEILWIYHRNDGDNLIRVSADYELTSNTSISVYGDFFKGMPDELFGQFDKKDRLGLKLSVGF